MTRCWKSSGRHLDAFFDRKRPTKMMMSCGNTTKTLVFEFAYTFTYIYIDAKYTVCTVYLKGIYIYIDIYRVCAYI